MRDEVDQETIDRDKLLLDLMIHAYDEDVARNELVDNKIVKWLFWLELC